MRTSPPTAADLDFLSHWRAKIQIPRNRLSPRDIPNGLSGSNTDFRSVNNSHSGLLPLFTFSFSNGEKITISNTLQLARTGNNRRGIFYVEKEPELA